MPTRLPRRPGAGRLTYVNALASQFIIIINLTWTTGEAAITEQDLLLRFWTADSPLLGKPMARKTESKIGPLHREVLRLLAKTPHGHADVKLIAQFTVEIFELIAVGFAEVHAENAREESGRMIETVCVRITAAGQRAIEVDGKP